MLLFVLTAPAAALEVSSAFKRAQTLAGSPLRRCLGSAAALGGYSAEPPSREELPAPSSGDELLRTRKGRAGDDITLLHEFPAGRPFLRFKTILPSRGSEAGCAQAPGALCHVLGREHAAGKQGQRLLLSLCRAVHFVPGILSPSAACWLSSHLARLGAPSSPRTTPNPSASLVALLSTRYSPGSTPEHLSQGPSKKRIKPPSFKIQTTSKLFRGTKTLQNAIPVHYT